MLFFFPLKLNNWNWLSKGNLNIESHQLMPNRIKLKSQDFVKGFADTVLHSQIICIKLHKLREKIMVLLIKSIIMKFLHNWSIFKTFTYKLKIYSLNIFSTIFNFFQLLWSLSKILANNFFPVSFLLHTILFGAKRLSMSWRSSKPT